MAHLEFLNVGVAAIAAAVPRNIVNNYNYTAYFPPEDVKEIVDKIGVKERRFADAGICSSDLCFAAAEKLFADMDIDKNEIDILIFISQTPDYRMPATSVILQNRLGLPHSTMTLDINIGCSGFIYGLSVVYAVLKKLFCSMEKPGQGSIHLKTGKQHSYSATGEWQQ